MIGQGQPQYKRYGAGDRENWWINFLKALGGGDASDIERMIEDEKFKSSQVPEPRPSAREAYRAMSPDAQEWLQQKNLQDAATKQSVSGVPTVVPTTATKKYVSTPEGKKWAEQGPGLDPEAYVPFDIESDSRVGSVYPDGGFQQEEILAKFKEMNPNLDWDKVADQVRAKGGNPNVPGGTLSVMPDTRPYAQSDEAYIQWVKDSTYEQELARRRDPRSRAYDPEVAQQMVNERALEQGNAVDMLKALAEQQKAAAMSGEVDVVRRRMMLEQTPQGRMSVILNGMLSSIDPTTDKTIRAIIWQAQQLNDRGRTDEANQVLQELYAMSSAGQSQANQAGVPQEIG